MAVGGCLRQPGVWFGMERSQTLQVQYPPHAFAFHWVALRIQPGCHLPSSIEWCSGVLLIEHSHQHQVLLAFRHRLVIVTGARQTQQVTLLHNAQVRMPWLNERSVRLNGMILIFFPTSLPGLSVGRFVGRDWL